MNTKNSSTPTKKYKTLVSAIHSIYRLVNSTFEVKNLIIRLTKLVGQMFDVGYCLIVLLDPSKNYSIFRCQIIDGKRIIIDKRKRIVDMMEKKIIKNISSVKKANLLAMPLVCEDIMGFIVIKDKKGRRVFDKFDEDMLVTIIEEAVIGIKNLQLYEEHQKLLLGSVKSMVTLLDTRIPQEYTHSPYFSGLVGAIAHQMNLDEKQTESLKYASLLHDAGKIDIPLKILTKTSKLTPHEYRIIRDHPVRGAKILRHLQVIRPAIPIIMHHHEKYNGTGYPSKLKKGQIPLGARIMAVADAFEAMVYGRPYRERKDIASAIREIRSKSGSQFDPKVVEAFLKAVKKINTKKYLKLNAQKQ